ncbi:hypothetical protein V6Z11_D01G112700 [Gossypium hirsutum]
MTSTFFFLGVNQTHEALGQWCVVFMSFGVKEMDLGEDVDAVDGGLYFLLYIIDRNGSRHMGAIHSSK